MIPIPVSWWICAGLVVALGVQQIHISQLDSRWDKHLLTDAKKVEEHNERVRKIEGDWAKKLEAADERYADDLDSMRADLANSSLAADGLRGELAKYRKRAVCTPVVPGGKDQPGGDPIGVLADMLTRLDARAEIYAATADSRKLVATKCEGSYDAVSSERAGIAGGRADGPGGIPPVK